MQVEADRTDTLILLQNNYFKWKASVNGNTKEIQPYAIAFMSVSINRGANTIRFFYDSHKLVIFTIISALAWIAFTFVILLKKAGTGRNNSPDIFHREIQW